MVLHPHTLTDGGLLYLSLPNCLPLHPPQKNMVVECVICLEPAKKPVKLPCKHQFCGECFEGEGDELHDDVSWIDSIFSASSLTDANYVLSASQAGARNMSYLLNPLKYLNAHVPAAEHIFHQAKNRYRFLRLQNR